MIAMTTEKKDIKKIIDQIDNKGGFNSEFVLTNYFRYKTNYLSNSKKVSSDNLNSSVDREFEPK